MVTDEQLTQYVRVSMRDAAADLSVPAGLLDGISPRHGWRGPRLPSAFGLLAGFSTAVALGVAALLVVLLGHGHVPQTRVVALATPGRTGATSLAQLRSELAVLRQPQRAADKLPGWGVAAEQRQNCSNCLNVAKLLPSESRLLATVHVPRGDPEAGPVERLYLVVGTVPRRWQNGLASGWGQSGAAGRGLHLSLVGLGTKHSPQAQPTDELLNSAQTAMPSQALSPRDVMMTSFETVGVVPDGVTRVKWELANPGQRKPAVVYPLVRGNAATAPWTPAPRSTQLLNEQLLVGATWYASDGHVVASYSRTMPQINAAYSSP